MGRFNKQKQYYISAQFWMEKLGITYKSGNRFVVVPCVNTMTGKKFSVIDTFFKQVPLHGSMTECQKFCNIKNHVKQFSKKRPKNHLGGF